MNMSSVKVLKRYPIQKFWTIDLSTEFQVLDPPCEEMNARFTTVPKPLSEKNRWRRIVFIPKLIVTSYGFFLIVNWEFLMQRQRRKLSEFKSFTDEKNRRYLPQYCSQRQINVLRVPLWIVTLNKDTTSIAILWNENILNHSKKSGIKVFVLYFWKLKKALFTCMLMRQRSS